MRLYDAGQALLKLKLTRHNAGDVDVPMVAGAIATVMHGTGKQLATNGKKENLT